MRHLLTVAHQEFFSVTHHPGEPVVFATPKRPFVALLWDHDGVADDSVKEHVIERLLDAGCRYFVCGGVACELWHDFADEIFVFRTLDLTEDEIDAVFAPTTWHTDESLDDVAFFFALNTSIDGAIPDRFLVVNVGRRPNEEVDRAVRKQWISE